MLDSSDPAYSIERAQAGKDQARRVITKPECVAAIKQVLARLGTTKLTRCQYDDAREAINAEAKRRHLHGRHIVPLPHSQQITVTCGSFAAALNAAGAMTAQVSGRTKITRAHAVEVFVEHFGFRPSQRDLQWFGRHHRIQMVMLHREPHGRAIEAARQRFEELGRWFPPAPPPGDRAERPEDWEQLGEGSEVLADLAQRFPRLRTTREGYSPEEIREAISKAYDALPPGQRLTGALYRERSGELGLPSLKTIYQAAADDTQTFRALVKAEEQRRAKAARARSRP